MAEIVVLNSRKRLSIGNEQAARLWRIGTDWTTLRIGMTFSIEAASFGLIPVFRFGICSGASRLVGDATAKHFVGVGDPAGTCPYTAGPPAYITQNTLRVLKKVGATVTRNGGGISSPIASASGAVAAVALFVQFEKGSPWTVRTGHAQTAAAGTDISTANFRTGLEQSTMPGSGWMANYSIGADTISVDEAANGYLDCLAVQWDQSARPLTIDAIGFARIA